MKKYYPEGARADIEAVEKRLSSPAELKNAFLSGESLEARAVLCDRGHNLDVDLRCMKGFMPRKECAMGIENNTVRDIAIISRVNKPVDFVITGFSENERGETFALLSRRKLQEECAANYTSSLIPGDIIDARVTHLEPFGAFCDIGAGISALMPIDGISVSRIPHPCVRFSVNQDIKAVVKSIDENGRITLSQKELLGTWEENASKFAPGETVPGVIRSVEDYGIFVELAPNLAGLAECALGPRAGDSAAVYIKSINPERMKIKLIIVDYFTGDGKSPAADYFISDGHIDKWTYSPETSIKRVETDFMS